MGTHRRDLPMVAVGVVLSGVVSAAVVAVEGDGAIGGAFLQDPLTVYGPPQAVLAIALTVVGLLLLALRGREAGAGLLGVGGMCAAQLASTGVVAYRKWRLYWGCCSTASVTEQTLVRTLAAVMALVCAVTAVAALVVLVLQRFLGWRGWGAAVAYPLVLVVIVAVPRVMAGGWGDKTDLVAGALMYSLPFGAALLVATLMTRVAGLAVVGAVVCSALIATLGQPWLESNLPFDDALPLVIIAAVAVGACRLIPRGRRPSAQAAHPS